MSEQSTPFDLSSMVEKDSNVEPHVESPHNTTSTSCGYGTINSEPPTSATASVPQKAPVKSVLDDLIPGYPKLAGRMGVLPQIAMFRRFGALNARNLLYIQNDLVWLEKQLKDQESIDSVDDRGKKKYYAFNSRWITTAHYCPNHDGVVRDGDRDQQELVLSMRKLLNEYNQALIQQNTIAQMKIPSRFDLDDIQAFIACEEMLEDPFIGQDRKIWGSYAQPESYSHDLVVLRPRKTVDPFSGFVVIRAISWISALGGRYWKTVDKRFGKICLDDTTVLKFTLNITSAIAAALPIIFVRFLLQQETLNGRLWVIAAFNVLIFVCLCFFKEARRADLFLVSAVLAAGEVMFVGQAPDKGL